MKLHTTIFLVILLLILDGCSNTRFLADDQVLYTGQEKVNIIQGQKDIKLSSIRPHLQSVTAQKPNNSVFDRRILPPIGLWVYNYWEVDEQKKFGSWLHNALSKPPVLISDINPELSSTINGYINTVSAMFPKKEEGFFRSITEEGIAYSVGGWVNETTTVRWRKE